MRGVVSGIGRPEHHFFDTRLRFINVKLIPYKYTDTHIK